MNELLEAPTDAILRHKPNRRLSREQRIHRRNAWPLAHQLRVLGIQPFAKQSVKAYQAKKLDELKNPVQPKRDVRSYVLTFFVIGLFACLIVTLYPSISSITSCLLGLTFSVFLWTVTGPLKIYGRYHVEWRSVEIGVFVIMLRRKVPPEALQLVRELQMRLPGVLAYVEYLDTDPLLRVYYVNPTTQNCEDEYLYVWDEPEFSAS